MYMSVQSPWLPDYIDVTQTFLVILTMAGLSPDRPHNIYLYLYLYLYISISVSIDVSTDTDIDIFRETEREIHP